MEQEPKIFPNEITVAKENCLRVITKAKEELERLENLVGNDYSKRDDFHVASAKIGHALDSLEEARERLSADSIEQK